MPLFDDLKGVPLEVVYTHVHNSFVANLVTWRSGHWRISPLKHYDGTHAPVGSSMLRPNCRVLGFTLPNYAELLGVSAATATEYLARVVIHDIGHSWLPTVDTPQEELHDVVMIAASQRHLHGIVPNGAWEQFILDECTSPLFFMERSGRIAECRRQWPDHRLRMSFVDQLEFVSSAGRLPFETIWGCTIDAPFAERRTAIARTIARLVRTSFVDYKSPT